MKLLKQLTWIIVFSFLGEILNRLIPLPVPASVYGLVLLFLSLVFGRIKLEQVEEAADYLIQIMPIFFIPPTVSIITLGEQLDFNSVLQIGIISIASTIVVIVITGWVAQFLIRRKTKGGQKHE